MPNTFLVKQSLQHNKKAFSNLSELDDDLFVEIENREEEKASGGGVGTSPVTETNLVNTEKSPSKWAFGFLF